MSTRNIVPRSDGEGQLGTTLKRWLGGFFNWLNVSQYIKFTAYECPHEEGKLFYDNFHKTLCYYNENSEVTVNIGQENLIRVYNDTGSEISDGKVVYIDGSFEDSHPFPTIKLAKSDNMITARAIGVTTNNIADGEYGYVNSGGEIHGLDLSGFDNGDVVYLSDTEAGGLTTTVPTIAIRIGFVIHSGTGASGILLVSLQEFGESVGDMLKTTYDTNSNDIVDKAEALNDGATGDGNNCPALEVRDHLDDLVSDRKHLTDEQESALGDLDLSTGNGIVTENDIYNSYIESEGESTTTDSINFQQKLRLSFVPVEIGDYLVKFVSSVANSGANKGTDVKIELDDTTIINSITVANVIADNYTLISGFKKISFSDTNTHTIDIDFKLNSTGTAKLRSARIFIKRM